jgi:cytochrome bd-type quinol oxidase subunit 2
MLEPLDEQSRTRLRPAFARDVLVNVLANLIAAAIIYLLAAAANVLPRNAVVIRAAVLILVGAVAYPATIFSGLIRNPKRRRLVLVSALVALAAAFGLGYVLFPNAMNWHPKSWWEFLAYPATFLVLYIIFVSKIRLERRLKRPALKEPPDTQGNATITDAHTP